MPVSAARVAVSTSAVALNTASPGGERLVIKNAGAVAADLGPIGVVSGAGFDVAATGGTVQVELDPGDVLYAISSGAGTSLAVLRT
jgi:hypothetical protein